MAQDDEEPAATGEVVVEAVEDAERAAEALRLLDAAASRAGAPLVDESEHVRLRRLAAGTPDPVPGWQPMLARRDGGPVGYAGVVVPAVDRDAVGDVAVDRDAPGSGEVLAGLLDAVSTHARGRSAAHLQVWLRHATPDEVATAGAAGFAVERRLHVLGRPLDEVELVEAPAGVAVRAYRPDVDDVGVVEVLAAAYAGTAEAGWDLERFVERRRLDWFRPEDLLVAEDAAGRVLGIHWLKRRSARVGEVYNLAVGPAAQGLGLGPVLLAAGLDHLRSVGCREVILWVDAANERAVALYRSAGFEPRWDDVALGRDLPG